MPDDRLPDDVPTIAPEDRVRRRGATKRLFISYSHADLYAVNQIVKRLNEEFYYDIWIDYDGIRGGTQWGEEIARGIQDADRVLLMLSPTALPAPGAGRKSATRWTRASVSSPCASMERAVRRNWRR